MIRKGKIIKEYIYRLIFGYRISELISRLSVRLSVGVFSAIPRDIIRRCLFVRSYWTPLVGSSIRIMDCLGLLGVN